MTGSVTWMWIGNRPQLNADPNTPVGGTDAARIVGHHVVGGVQIRPVELTGDLRPIQTAQGPVSAFATTYNRHPSGPSTFSYASPGDDAPASGRITGFLQTTYQVTMSDGTAINQNGVLIQMDNGDMFFRPSLASVDDWAGITSLHSIRVLQAAPLNAQTYAAVISFRPEIFDLQINCFVAGTMILTASGPAPVETLAVGDMIWTRDRGYQPLRWTGTSRFDAIDLRLRPKLRPVRIAAGALGPGSPSRTLRVSRQHRILLRSDQARRLFGTDEILAPACQLTDLPGIEPDGELTDVTYHHLMFDAHEVLESDGALTESFYPGPQAMQAMGPEALAQIAAIFPELREACCPWPKRAPFVGARPFVRGRDLRRLVAGLRQG